MVDADEIADDGGACTTEGERQHLVGLANHVDSIDRIQYSSNPPSGGPHCPAWGQYAVYSPSKPLARCNYLHNLEHGGVVLLYNCPRGCPEILSALTKLYNDGPRDPDCPRSRLILTPDPALDVQVAAAAWGFTWKSTCLDEPGLASLTKFINDHWGSKGLSPEPVICSDGSVSP